MEEATGSRVRLRQAVLVARELEPTVEGLERALGVAEPFRDPGVVEFGLVNAVFALGDCFLEVISPAREDTAAGRYLERHGGDGGYMVIFDLEDLASARERARAKAVRVVWQIDLPDISGTHLHPADMKGAIVSIDQSRPYGSWRWGGPQWTASTAEPGPGHLQGVTIAVDEPASVAARWGEVLGVGVSERRGPTIELDGGEVRFIDAPDAREQGLVEIAVSHPAGELAREGAIELAGARLQAV